MTVLKMFTSTMLNNSMQPATKRDAVRREPAESNGGWFQSGAVEWLGQSLHCEALTGPYVPPADDGGYALADPLAIPAKRSCASPVSICRLPVRHSPPPCVQATPLPAAARCSFE